MSVFAGLLNINKPPGVSSYWVVHEVKKVLGVKKAGHCGTLDPLAQGVLLVLFGPATKMQSSLMSQKKIYRVRLLLGVTTDTGDVTGKILVKQETAQVSPTRLDNLLEKFTGEIQQIPPMYSALKFKGRRLYELAREGKSVERLPRPVTIYRLELLRYGPSCLELRVECSRGTYIRTLGEDIGRELGCGATVENLVRERVGAFGIEAAIDGRTLRAFSRDELYGKKHSVEEVQGSLCL
ncbi:MAG: tRNA pseudouridine(55) synthase TruB [Endomicrobiales bacterium]